MKIKEKILESFGAFGGILYFLFMFILFILPVTMITVSFDLPFWASAIMIAILFIIPSVSNIFWIIGLIGAFLGPQDIVSTIYYVASVIVFLPNILIILSSFFKKDE